MPRFVVGWTKKMDAELVSLWGAHSAPQVARAMGLTSSQVYSRVCYLRARGREIRAGQMGRPKGSSGHSIGALLRGRPRRDVPMHPPPPVTEWPDGWRIRPPTKEQLMAGR